MRHEVVSASGLASPIQRYGCISFVVEAVDRKLPADAQYLDAVAVRCLVADGRNDGSAYLRFATAIARLNDLKPFAVDQQPLRPEADTDERREAEVLERERLNAMR